MGKKVFILIFICIWTGKSIAQEKETEYYLPMSYYYGRIVDGIGAELNSDYNGLIFFGKKETYLIGGSVAYSVEQNKFDKGPISLFIYPYKGYFLQYQFLDVGAGKYYFMVANMKNKQIKVNSELLNFVYYYGLMLNKHNFELSINSTGTKTFKYGLTDNCQFGLNYSNDQYVPSVIFQVNNKLRLYVDLYTVDKPGYRYRRIDLSHMYVTKNKVSYERILADEDNYYFHLLDKKQVKWDGTLFLSQQKYTTRTIDTFFFSETVTYGITNNLNLYINSYGQIGVTDRGAEGFYTDYYRLSFMPGINAINYPVNEQRKISNFSRMYYKLLKKSCIQLGLYLGFGYEWSDNYAAKLDLDTKKYFPSIYFAYGINDNTQLTVRIYQFVRENIINYNFYFYSYYELFIQKQISENMRITAGVDYSSHVFRPVYSSDNYGPRIYGDVKVLF